MIQVPERQAEIDALAREVANAATKLDRGVRDGSRYFHVNVSDLEPDQYRYHLAVQRYEQATRNLGATK